MNTFFTVVGTHIFYLKGLWVLFYWPFFSELWPRTIHLSPLYYRDDTMVVVIRCSCMTGWLPFFGSPRRIGYLYVQCWNCKRIAKFFFFNFRFPLHDKERLEKWLKNMKRDSWVPSKYQFLCSDHFTPDSLDIRWGIRYLKQTAIPTIFSLPEDDQVLEARCRGGGDNAEQ